jgi:hypothetical protein
MKLGIKFAPSLRGRVHARNEDGMSRTCVRGGGRVWRVLGRYGVAGGGWSGRQEIDRHGGVRACVRVDARGSSFVAGVVGEEEKTASRRKERRRRWRRLLGGEEENKSVKNKSIGGVFRRAERRCATTGRGLRARARASETATGNRRSLADLKPPFCDNGTRRQRRGRGGHAYLIG